MMIENKPTKGLAMWDKTWYNRGMRKRQKKPPPVRAPTPYL
jgi:hypothetical protein